MKSRFVMSFIPIAALIALTLPLQVLAQKPRYKLVDLGTFGGPNSFANGPTVPTLSGNGIYAGEADTSIPDPFAPFCQSPDCLVQHAQEWRNGVVIDLGTLPGVNLSSGATWVSGNGIIGGASENGLIDPLLGTPELRAVVWKNGQIFDLGTLDGGYESFVPAVNDSEQVAAWSLNLVPDPFSMAGGSTQTRGFLWQHGAKQDLGTLGGPDALPEAMNQSGQIIGTSYTNSTPIPTGGFNCPPNVPATDPFFWEEGEMVDIGTLGGTCGVANLINNSGQVVGTSSLVGNQTHHAFLWEHRALKDLGTLGGLNSEAFWITDSGLIVGRADFSPQGANHHAYLLKNDRMIDLGTLAPWPCSTAYSVNSRGQVIGDTGICGEGGGPSFFSENGESMVDINTLVLHGSEIEVVDAYDINDRGEIAGLGMLPNGDVHAVLLIPASEEEIAAAAALNESHSASRFAQTVVKGNSENSASRRQWPLFQQAPRMP
jgi:probable HAF family extracellular repeat protein